MLFNSFSFIFCFLPLAAFGFFAIGKVSRFGAATWLLAASLAFYGWWDTRYLALLAISILGNFGFGLAITKAHRCQKKDRVSRLLIAAVALNIAVLCYYKYANFFAGSLAGLVGWKWQMMAVVLPLGISFFTFTQIAYLVDCARGKVQEANLIHYALFVTYFPHLIAGPVLHHEEMMPQFSRPETYRLTAENIAVGLTIFFIGLFKKVVIADGIAPHVAPVFNAAASGQTLTVLEAHGGVLSYAFQLYFDFSGYSDMAIGISRIFGVVLPLNFDSPYKAVNIIDFWRRWHMTLSRFLRDYLYFSLGGNRRGKARRYVNLMATMVLGGLWHGAAWTFVIWGAIHGALLAVNHGWHAVKARHLPALPGSAAAVVKALSIAVTFYTVVIAWVFFRADRVGSAMTLLKAMFGFNGWVFPAEWQRVLGAVFPWAADLTFRPASSFVGALPLNWLCWLFAVVWLLPNTQQVMACYRPALGVSGSESQARLTWHPNLAWTIAIALMALVGLLQLSHVSEFLYFQF